MKEAILGLFRPTTRSGPVDQVLAAVVIALLGFSVVMVFSASTVEANLDFGDPYHYLKRQTVYVILAVIVLAVTSHLDYARIRPFTYPLLAVVMGLMLAVILFGHTGGGATRWLKLGPIHLQPSELAKVAIVLWLAYSLDKKREQIRSFSVGLLPHLLMVGVLILLCLAQPDFGSAVVLTFITFTMLFIAGAKLSYLGVVGGVGLGAAAWLVRFKAYRWERMLAWFDMEEHRQDLAYQPFQSVMSFGSGQFSGMGLGKGLQGLYLPEAYTDFISAILAEELGFLGLLGLISCYTIIVVRGFRAAFETRDEYGSYIAVGISVLFGVQSLVNLSVAMAMLPTKGLTLPFMSYGGSSLLVSALAMGILLNISRQRLSAALPTRFGGAAVGAGSSARQAKNDFEAEAGPLLASHAGLGDALESAEAL